MMERGRRRNLVLDELLVKSWDVELDPVVRHENISIIEQLVNLEKERAVVFLAPLRRKLHPLRSLPLPSDACGAPSLKDLIRGNVHTPQGPHSSMMGQGLYI